MQPRYVSRISKLLELKSQVEEREISSQELADFVGVSRQAVHLWMKPEGNRMLPKAENQARICEYFGVPFHLVWSIAIPEEESNGR